MSERTENEKGTILEAVRMAFDEFGDYDDIRRQAAEDESDFSFSISVKIPDGEQKVCVKVSGSIKKVAVANAYFEDDGQLKLDFDTESQAREIERSSKVS